MKNKKETMRKCRICVDPARKRSNYCSAHQPGLRSGLRAEGAGVKDPQVTTRNFIVYCIRRFFWWQKLQAHCWGCGALHVGKWLENNPKPGFR